MMDRFSNILLLSTVIILLTFIGISCGNQDTTTDKNYVGEINDWHNERIASLEERDSWLSLAGLYKLKEGSQSFGSDSTNDIIFPPQAPSRIGTINKQDDTISIRVLPNVKVVNDGAEVSEIEMTLDSQDQATVLQHEAFLWYIIERRGDYYIRLKDTNHPNFKSFDGIERFPVSQDWRIKATFKPFEEPKSITVPDVLNEGIQDSLYGMLEFTIDGKEYNIAPLNHPEKDEEFFIIFGDQTNGESTYSGGRYIYIPTPDENGITYLDFNKAYNPPCVFTHFATCPLPPSQNRLPLKITAGEKMYN